MLTKDQEREALKKIQMIIESTGADSYLALTFDGIIEQADDNITNDFASNYKELYETQTEKLKEAKADIKALVSQYDDLKDKYGKAESSNTVHIKALEEAAEKICQYERQHNADKNEIEALQAEIITLKAKLYDLMTA